MAGTRNAPLSVTMLNLLSSDVTSFPTAQLTGYIVWRHHRLLREMLPSLQRMATKAVRVHGRRHPEIRLLSATLDVFAGLVLPHMAVEERFLFPALTAARPDAALIRSEIADTEGEHARIEELLDELRDIAAEEPVKAISSRLSSRLAELDADMRRHLALERDVLLARFRAS